MNRVYNFSAGPSQLPEEVLKIAASEMLSYNGSGMSVMEMSHRSAIYESIITECESLYRKILGIPDNYKVLFLQGGASTQFSMVPLNLMKNGKADYVVTGLWAKKAYAEGQKFGDCKLIASSADKTFTYIPELSPDTFRKDADYFYICYNNTIYGTKFPSIPDTGDVPLVADMSSCIMSEEIDVSKFGIIFAGAQKNLGPAGVTVVIIRDDLITDCPASVPTMMQYKTHSENGSMFNTPPTYSIYICKLVLDWVMKQGGLKKINEICRKKAELFYNYLDSSSLFKATVFGADRSLTNIPFVTGNEDLDKEFIKAATDAGFMNLKGHRTVGGMRASIYNGMPIEGVTALIDFMKDFESKK